MCVCVCVCVSKLFGLTKYTVLKDAEKHAPPCLVLSFCWYVDNSVIQLLCTHLNGAKIYNIPLTYKYFAEKLASECFIYDTKNLSKCDTSHIKNTICREKGCQPFPVQTPSVQGTNADLSIVILRPLKLAISNFWTSKTKESSQKRGEKLRM